MTTVIDIPTRQSEAKPLSIDEVNALFAEADIDADELGRLIEKARKLAHWHDLPANRRKDDPWN